MIVANAEFLHSRLTWKIIAYCVLIVTVGIEI